MQTVKSVKIISAKLVILIAIIVRTIPVLLASIDVSAIDLYFVKNVY
jgi:hypothetical protein